MKADFLQPSPTKFRNARAWWQNLLVEAEPFHAYCAKYDGQASQPRRRCERLGGMMISVAAALLVSIGNSTSIDTWLEPPWGQSADQVIAANPLLESIDATGSRYRRPAIGASGPTNTPIGSFFAQYYFDRLELVRVTLSTTDTEVCEALRLLLTKLPGATAISTSEPGWVGETSRTKYEFTSAAPGRQGLPYYTCVLTMSRL